jgi:hypothetical protein
MPWDRTRNVDLGEFHRYVLTQGLQYHRTAGRGLVPAGLEEEIRALDTRRCRGTRAGSTRTPEPRRTFARASRRQAMIPDIPRPGKLRPEELTRRVTFGQRVPALPVARQDDDAWRPRKIRR